MGVTTGEGNTAWRWQCEGCNWWNDGADPECDGCGEPKSTALMSRSGALADLSDALAECVRLREQLDAARQALARLASTKGFEGAGYIGGDSLAERELRARGEFARAALGVEGPAAGDGQP